MKHDIIIFVHGSIFPIPSLKSLKISFCGEFKYRDALRFNTFYRYQPINTLGLHKITQECNDNTWTSRFSSAYWYEIFYRSQYSQQNQTNCSFYTFGWNGKLSSRQRERSAEQFYHELISLIKQLKNNEPSKQKISIIIAAHSHGGNIALNLALMEQRFQQALAIDELQLFGVPIQSETAAFIHAPFFKQIYHFYSSGDLFQKADIISSQDWGAQRTFEKKAQALPLPNKLMQFEVKIDHKIPAHAEFWFFGNPAHILYRKKLSTYPFPVLVFAPIIIAQVNQHLPTITQVLVTIKHEKKSFQFIFSPIHVKLKLQKVDTFKEYFFSLDLSNTVNHQKSD